MRTLRLLIAAAALLFLFVADASFAQQEVALTPSADNTLYESSNGTLSNGAGSFLFFGQTNRGSVRRALIKFDVAAGIPSGATIVSAALEVTVTKTIAPAGAVTVHRVQQDWGEGTSNANANEGAGAPATVNDATWKHTFFDSQTWQSLGGDYDAGTLTSAQAGSGGALAFPSTEALVSAVQSWLDSPAENFGLILVGNESSSPTTKRIGSREGVEADRPRLVVTYSVSTAVEHTELPAFLTALSTYPNPANTEVTIYYALRDARDVKIDLIDVTGRLVSTPVQGLLSAGTHAARIDTDNLTPGVYLVRLISGPESASRTLIVQ